MPEESKIPNSDLELDPAPEPQREIRFAVVMYGGVSLAIYIHGVAQELLSLVRATARMKDNDERYLIRTKDLKGAELVYRCLGETLNAKFVVDILSGTSAGGINAVYLAKALVNDKSMEKLKKLWVEEGDIAKLINDEQSLNNLSGLGLKDPPEALLNSQRMYYQLLYALKEMGSAPEGTPSPYVEQLDLNITTTDIRGLNLPIKIRNSSINELRYRTVFKFKYATTGTRRNDFTQEKDPFLAFAARCTSSIPPAFEAMQLQDIDPILKTSTFKDTYGQLLKSDKDPWRSFYTEYATIDDAFSTRSFGDGGYLDNKPFSYATTTLLNRSANLPVDRKLLYIEPSPEHPEARATTDTRPNMVENILAALVGLPRQETIRDDLTSILVRNEHIARTNKILAQVHDVFNKIVSVDHAPKSAKRKQSKFRREFNNWKGTKAEWPGQYLDEVIDDFGVHYPSYHQLRMEDVLDTLASIFASRIGWDEAGQEAKDLRVLLSAWRKEYYRTTSSDAEGHPEVHSENEILSRLDIRWRQRRIFFIQSLANILLNGLNSNDSADKEQAQILFQLSSTDGSDLDEHSDQYRLSLRELKEKFNQIMAEFDHSINLLSLASSENDNVQLKAYADQLWQLGNILATSSGKPDTPEANLHEFAELLLSNDAQANTAIAPTLKKIEDVTALLSPHYQPASSKAASETAQPAEQLSTYAIKEAFRELAIASANSLGEIGKNGEKREKYLSLANQKIEPAIHTKVQHCLKYFYDRFEFYDMLMFPLQFGTNFGESDEVEIVRISPEDATKFINERETGTQKLAGTKLSNFGAFFKEEWRKNDMLWGRLDGAEILLKELLTDNEGSSIERLRTTIWKRLADQGSTEYPSADKIDPYEIAFERILQEDFKPELQSILYKIMEGQNNGVDHLVEGQPGQPAEETSLVLQELIRKEIALRRLEEEIDSYLLDSADDALTEQLKRIRSDKADIYRAISEEKLRLQQNAQARRMRQNRGAWENFREDVKEAVRSISEGIRQKPGKIQVSVKKTDQQELSRTVSDGRRLLHYFKYGYQINRDFDIEPTIELAGRSAQTMTRLLNGLSETYPIQKPVSFLTFILQITLGLVNLALPKSFLNFLFQGYWVWLLYLAEGILWIAGLLTGNTAITNLGSAALIVTVALHFLIFQINRWISGVSKRKYGVWLFYIAETIAWLIGSLAGIPSLARIGAIALAITLGIHATTEIGRNRPSARWLRPALIGLLILVFVSVFYLGLAYLHILPEPTGSLHNLILKIQSFFPNKAG